VGEKLRIALEEPINLLVQRLEVLVGSRQLQAASVEVTEVSHVR
jgi:hypothetical protein